MRIFAVFGRRPPEPEHRSSLLTDPEKNDVPARIAISQTPARRSPDRTWPTSPCSRPADAFRKGAWDQLLDPRRLRCRCSPTAIGLRQPGTKLRIDFAGCGQSEKVHMIPGRDRLNPAEPRMLEPPCQHQVTIQPVRAGRHLGKRHAHLESDPCFLRKNPHRAQRSNRRHHRIEEHPDLHPFALEMVLQVRPPAGMRLIAIGKAAPALPAVPKRLLVSHRNSLRMTSFNPDQVSSTAQTLMSTNPSGKATSRMTSSVMSVLTPELFFGQETQSAPFGSIVFRNDWSFFSVRLSTCRIGARTRSRAQVVSPKSRKFQAAVAASEHNSPVHPRRTTAPRPDSRVFSRAVFRSIRP